MFVCIMYVDMRVCTCVSVDVCMRAHVYLFISVTMYTCIHETSSKVVILTAVSSFIFFSNSLLSRKESF